MKRARVQSQVERSEQEGNLDGFLARLHSFSANEGKETGLKSLDFGDAIAVKRSQTVHCGEHRKALLGREFLREIPRKWSM